MTAWLLSGDMNEVPMRISRLIWLALLLTVLSGVTGCHNESNPAVPPAPEGDIVRIMERNQVLKIGLLSFTPQKHLYISITRGILQCYKGESLESFADGLSGDTLKFTGGEESIEFTDAGSEDSRDLEIEMIRIEPDEGVENGYLKIGTSKNNVRPYRGIIYLVLEGKNLLAINEVELEFYLQGVVPAEVDPSWPEQALRAQAIASRTFALFHMPKYEERGFNLADDERSQKYGGYSVETESATDAVIETTNVILVYDIKVAAVVFHDESIGETASHLDVWPDSGDIPYLIETTDVTPTVDFSAGGPYGEWSNRASFEQLHSAFNRDGETFVGTYLSAVTILNTSENGRVQSIDLLGEKNPVVDAITLSHVLGRNLETDFLPSNRFTLTLEGVGYRFTGSGKGHGVGMSQWGMYQRAEFGQEYDFILQHYYPGCEIVTIPLDGIEAVHNIEIDTIL